MTVIPLTTELYRFTGRNNAWYYTSGEESVVWGGQTYNPIPIGRSAPEATQDISKAGLEVYVDRTNVLAAEFLRYIGDDIVSLDVFQWDQDTADFAMYWKGRIVDISTDGDEVHFNVESFFTSLRRAGLRARFSKLCRHDLYGPLGCRVNPASHVTPLVWTNYADRVLTVTNAGTYGDHWFAGGKVIAPDGSEGFILNHTGDSIKLSRHLDYFTQPPNGTTADFYPGCNKTLGACQDKFNNIPNYGGFAWIPSKNPLGGSSII